MSEASGGSEAASTSAVAAASASAEADLIMTRADELARHSQSATGIDRQYLTPEHAAVNALAAGWMREAGMTTWQDAAGNQCGRLPGAGGDDLPVLLLASHLDSVPDAGRYDGILGVLIAIAAVARIPAGTLPFHLDVIAFGDEEGTRFGRTLLGSAAVGGTWDPAWADLTDAAGITLRQAATAFGLDPDRIGDAARSPASLAGYLEVHIEQGPILEREDLPLAVVTSIAGARRLFVTVQGDARHCATPWELRHDALVGASEAIVAIERLGRSRATPVTVGHIRVEPDAVNVIPGLAEFSVDIRDSDDAARDATLAAIQQELAAIGEARGLVIDWRQTHEATATACAPRLREAIGRGIRSATGLAAEAPVRELYSVAGHDAMAVAAATDVAMLFVRCKGGISHSPEESVRSDDVAVALDAFHAAVLAVAEEESAR